MLFIARSFGLPDARPRASFYAFFSYGFRPFFLGTAMYAVVLMAVWIVVLMSGEAGLAIVLPPEGSPAAWHAHEMIFGFAMAAVAGFLLTAVPNWTGALPISGTPLVVLFIIWLLGRAAMLMAGALPFGLAAAIDFAFVPVLGAFAARQLFVRPAARNLVFLAILLFLATANLAYHLASLGLAPLNDIAGPRAAMLLLVLMTAIIGGRIVPAFTHNWLHLNLGSRVLPRRIAWLDVASVVSIMLYVAAATFGGDGVLSGGLALVAAGLNGARLLLWCGWATCREPIVLVLHLGYAWIVAGLAMAAAAGLYGGLPASLVSHAFGTGAIGTMILAVMTRASLGHTGRRITAPRPIVMAYVLVSLAAVVRVVVPLISWHFYHASLAAAAFFWIAAFGIFAVHYGPILVTPRVRALGIE